MIDPGHLASQAGEFLRQHPAAAADVQQAHVAQVRAEALPQRIRKVGHAPGVDHRP